MLTDTTKVIFVSVQLVLGIKSGASLRDMQLLLWCFSTDILMLFISVIPSSQSTSAVLANMTLKSIVK